MNLLEAVANWHGCPYGLKRCKDNCVNFMVVDPRSGDAAGVGPGTKAQRDLCSLFEDLDRQITERFLKE